jgi:hypothetical protein
VQAATRSEPQDASRREHAASCDASQMGREKERRGRLAMECEAHAGSRVAEAECTTLAGPSRIYPIMSLCCMEELLVAKPGPTPCRVRGRHP